MKSNALMLTVVACLVAFPAMGQEDTDDELAAWFEYLDSIDWVQSGDVGRMGDQALIDVPDGYVFTGRDGTQRLMEAFGNLLSDQEMGFVAPKLDEGNPDFDWFAVFEFDDIGYVPDDEKADLDPDEMLASMVENEKLANEKRREMGYETLNLLGWAMEPTYNEQTNNLEWAINLQSGGGDRVTNLNTRLLGREGVMKVTLVCDPEALTSTIPVYQEMLTSFGFQDGQRYAEYRKGDKIAKYGLTGLIVGGGVAALAKTGLLKKLLKPILIGLAALGLWIKKLFTGGGGSD